MVKRNPTQSAKIRNRERKEGRGARVLETIHEARRVMRQQDVGIMDEDGPAKELVLENEKGLPGEDVAYRYINDLPKVLLPYAPATDLDKVPHLFECNICDEAITPITSLDADGKEVEGKGVQSEMERRILRRRLLNCIAEDHRSEERKDMERIAKLSNKAERDREERGRGE